jgi:hypothetical protein
VAEVDPTCPICRLETETITHVITSWPLYNEIRKEHFVKIKGTVITAIGFDSWKRNFNKKDIKASRSAHIVLSPGYFSN